MTKSFISALSLATLLIIGPASTSASVITDVDTHINTASVLLSVDDDNVATLTGVVKSFYDKAELERATLELDDVVKVRNLLATF